MGGPFGACRLVRFLLSVFGCGQSTGLHVALRTCFAGAALACPGLPCNGCFVCVVVPTPTHTKHCPAVGLRRPAVYDGPRQHRNRPAAGDVGQPPPALPLPARFHHGVRAGHQLRCTGDPGREDDGRRRRPPRPLALPRHLRRQQLRMSVWEPAEQTVAARDAAVRSCIFRCAQVDALARVLQLHSCFHCATWHCAGSLAFPTAPGCWNSNQSCLFFFGPPPMPSPGWHKSVHRFSAACSCDASADVTVNERAAPACGRCIAKRAGRVPGTQRASPHSLAEPLS